MFKRYELDLTSTQAKEIELMPSLDTLGFTPLEEKDPLFTLSWEAGSLMDPEKSRFHLPSIFYKGTEIGRLGYRNKSGFILIREQIGEKEVGYIKSFVYRTANRAKNMYQEFMNQKKELQESIMGMIEESQKEPENNIWRGFEQFAQKIHPQEMISAIAEHARRSGMDVIIENDKSIGTNIRYGKGERTTRILVTRGDLIVNAALCDVSSRKGTYDVHEFGAVYLPQAIEQEARLNITDSQIRNFVAFCVEANSGKDIYMKAKNNNDVDLRSLSEDVHNHDFGYF